MSFAVLITCSGAIAEIDLPETSEARATVYRSVLRCDAYDVVALTSRLDMWLDDERLYRHPVNPLATLFAMRHGFVHQPYHGPVLLTGGANEDGDTLPLTGEQVVAHLRALEEQVAY
ncbi:MULTISPECIES: DUF3846 domain-containing protein [unclassified Streptomyces]|uniref:DUF3846 domain-containing protein n=1 Tax=unclassified Streptomyces TaxID=2593676 RepID=UPI000BAC5653|nr:DUF3846 domain-containing protein [Streptomyces sp. CLI2509]ASY36975.1 hypothetical protein CAC01_30505 [Streptomyces sp. CLI2509]MYX19642.1 DUF3846 domain-containing protein [Streptomyces sp. SID8380]